MLTGGQGSVFDRSEAASVGSALRRLLLALFIGANWIPQIGPTLVKASLMAADIRNSGLALGVLFAFGVGAAIPWILLGRILRLRVASVRRRRAAWHGGSSGCLACPCSSLPSWAAPGWTLLMAHWLDAVPGMGHKLSTTF